MTQNNYDTSKRRKKSCLQSINSIQITSACIWRLMKVPKGSERCRSDGLWSGVGYCDRPMGGCKRIYSLHARNLKYNFDAILVRSIVQWMQYKKSFNFLFFSNVKENPDRSGDVWLGTSFIVDWFWMMSTIACFNKNRVFSDQKVSERIKYDFQGVGYDINFANVSVIDI